MSCPRCNVGAVKGGTGCFVCEFCHSIFNLDMKYSYSYKTDWQKEHEAKNNKLLLL